MEKDIAIRIGRNIASARKQTNRTQADVAEKLGIDTGTLSRMERGIVVPGIPMLDRIADELSVALWQLLGTASSNTFVMAENIAAQLEKLNQAERLFLLKQIEDWVKKLSDLSPPGHRNAKNK